MGVVTTLTQWDRNTCLRSHHQPFRWHSDRCSGRIPPERLDAHSDTRGLFSRWHWGREPYAPLREDLTTARDAATWRHGRIPAGYSLHWHAITPGLRHCHSTHHFHRLRRRGATGAGGIVIEPCSTKASISDVLVENVESSGAHITGVQLGHHPHAPYDPAKDGHAGMTTPGCSMGLDPGATSPKTGIQNAVVKNSRLHDNDAIGLQVFGATNVLISHNELYRNGSGSGSHPANKSGMNGEGAWWDSTDRVTAEWNNAWGNREGYSGNDGARYPEAPDIMVSRPHPTGQVTALHIHNNTLIRQRSAPGIRLQAEFKSHAEVKIFNNITSRTAASPILSTTTTNARVFTNSDDAAGAPSYLYAGQNHPTLAAFQRATQEGTGNLTENPKILGWDYKDKPWPTGNTFRLAPDSPVRGMGTPLATRQLDFWGRDVPSGAPVAMGANSGS